MLKVIIDEDELARQIKLMSEYEIIRDKMVDARSRHEGITLTAKEVSVLIERLKP